MKRILLLTLTLILTLPVLAQTSRQEELEKYRIAYLTREMNLDTKQSQQFWPIYNEYRKELNALWNSKNANRRELRSEMDQMSDTEIQSLLDEQVRMQEEESRVLRKYHDQFKAVLPADKLAKFYSAEESFKRELVRRIQSRQSQGARPGPK